MAIDPPVKTKVSVDPDTGARVFNQSWSSELKKKEPISRKPVSRETFVTESKQPVKKVNISSVKTSGERNFSEVIKPKVAQPTVKAEIKTSSLPDRKITPKLTHGEVNRMKIQKDNEDLKKNYPGMNIEDARAKRYKERVKSAEKSAKENRRFFPIGTGDGSEKQKGTTCTTC